MFNKYNYAVYVFVLLVFSNVLLVKSFKNSPACHAGIMSLFRWCEQSECSNCTCHSKNHVCKQICNKRNCQLLFCSSPQTCYQSVLVEYGKAKPVVEKLVSHTPITQQDCSQATCKLMKAVRFDKTVSRSFQSCSEGKCHHVYSTADHAKQFCGNCDRMTCTGKHAKNCTQLCILGECKQVTCNAKHCTQLCSHKSTCNLTCGPNAETCDQTCSYGSTCVLKCEGKSCSQKCDGSKNCTKIVTHIPTTTTTTITTTTTSTTTEIDNNIPEVEVDDHRISKTSKNIIIDFTNNLDFEEGNSLPLNSSAISPQRLCSLTLSLTALTTSIYLIMKKV